MANLFDEYTPEPPVEVIEWRLRVLEINDDGEAVKYASPFCPREHGRMKRMAIKVGRKKVFMFVCPKLFEANDWAQKAGVKAEVKQQKMRDLIDEMCKYSMDEYIVAGLLLWVEPKKRDGVARGDIPIHIPRECECDLVADLKGVIEPNDVIGFKRMDQANPDSFMRLQVYCSHSFRAGGGQEGKMCGIYTFLHTLSSHNEGVFSKLSLLDLSANEEKDVEALLTKKGLNADGSRKEGKYEPARSVVVRRYVNGKLVLPDEGEEGEDDEIEGEEEEEEEEPQPPPKRAARATTSRLVICMLLVWWRRFLSLQNE